jgi:hypothetical protein
MSDAAKAADVSVYRHVIGRVGENEIDHFAIE